ncbi:MAG: hypothetical protein ACSHYA_08210 [Opitutaceae bacterium]
MNLCNYVSVLCVATMFVLSNSSHGEELSHDRFPMLGDDVDVFIQQFGENYLVERKSLFYSYYIWKFNDLSVVAGTRFNDNVRVVLIHKTYRLASDTDSMGKGQMLAEACAFLSEYTKVDDWKFLTASDDNALLYSPSTHYVIKGGIFEDEAEGTSGYDAHITRDSLMCPEKSGHVILFQRGS